MTTGQIKQPPVVQLLIRRCPCNAPHAVQALSLPTSIAPDVLEGASIALTAAGWWLFGSQWHCPDCGWAKVLREDKGWSTAVRTQAKWVGIVVSGFSDADLLELKGTPEPEETLSSRFAVARGRS